MRRASATPPKTKDLLREIEELRARLEEAESTLEAIRSGGVDALVVSGPEGERVYTLEGADYPYRVLVEVMSEGVVTLSPDGSILSCNSRFSDLVKRPAEEIIGRPFVEFAAEWDHDKLEEFLQQTAGIGAATTIALEAADDSKKPVNVSLGALNVGGVAASCAVVTDLTETFAAAQTKFMLASIVEGSNDAIISRSLDGIIWTWNAAAERIYGYSAEEAVGQPITILVPENGNAEPDMFIDKICKGERVESYETVRVTKDGRNINVAITLSPFRDAHGDVIGISTIVRDITERKRIEAELAAYRERLEELVERRTRELTRANNQLKVLTQDLQRSNRDLEQFAYIASHDLQEPLRQIIGFTQFLDERYRPNLDETAQELMGFIVDGGHRMQVLIQDLLMFSRVGRSEKPPQPTNLEDILDDVMQNLKTRIDENGAVITHDPLPTLKADASQLAQVFQNLITNALKFRGVQPPQIHIGARKQDGFWEFYVRDNGIGFKQQFADRIFNLFQRLQSHKDYPGTGIGLPICKRVIEWHGGKIWAQSAPGEGATFYFTLPRETNDE